MFFYQFHPPFHLGDSLSSSDIDTFQASSIRCLIRTPWLFFFFFIIITFLFFLYLLLSIFFAIKTMSFVYVSSLTSTNCSSCCATLHLIKYDYHAFITSSINEVNNSELKLHTCRTPSHVRNFSVFSSHSYQKVSMLVLFADELLFISYLLFL